MRSTPGESTVNQDYWTPLISSALRACGTPCYLFCWQPVQDVLDGCPRTRSGLPIRHWLSFKTQPLRPLVRRWKETGQGAEVVSEFELRAALREGFEPSDILVNGVAKHTWLTDVNVGRLRVQLDSLAEVAPIARAARELGWTIGIRCHVKDEHDADEPEFGGQFGLSQDEVGVAARELARARVQVAGMHFHLRSNVSSVSAYRRAVREVAAVSRSCGLHPEYVDCGGGVPVPGEYPTDGSEAAFASFNMADYWRVLDSIPALFDRCAEIWLENGRYLTARAGVFITRVVDVKNRPDCRYLICDGGRTNHALVSDWETHEFFTIPERNGTRVLTTVCGPTCMAFDRMVRQVLPDDIAVGDVFVWRNAGAYHIPWETRFSHGLAPVVWADANGQCLVARRRETFDEWWAMWC